MSIPSHYHFFILRTIVWEMFEDFKWEGGTKSLARVPACAKIKHASNIWHSYNTLTLLVFSNRKPPASSNLEIWCFARSTCVHTPIPDTCILIRNIFEFEFQIIPEEAETRTQNASRHPAPGIGFIVHSILFYFSGRRGSCWKLRQYTYRNQFNRVIHFHFAMEYTLLTVPQLIITPSKALRYYSPDSSAPSCSLIGLSNSCQPV